MDKNAVKKSSSEKIWRAIRNGTPTAVAVGLLSVLPVLPRASAQTGHNSGTIGVRECSQQNGPKMQCTTDQEIQYINLTQKEPLLLEETTNNHHYVVRIDSINDFKKVLSVELDGEIMSHKEITVTKGTSIVASIIHKDGEISADATNRSTGESVKLPSPVQDDPQVIMTHVPPSRLVVGRASGSGLVTSLLKEKTTQYIYQ